MESRVYARIKIIVPVRVFRTDASGRSMVGLAHSVDTSSGGLCLAGFHNIAAEGDVLEVQYRHIKARYRVVWVQPGTLKHELQMGLQCLEPHKHILPTKEPQRCVEERSVPDFQQERRSEPRFSIVAGAEIKPVADSSSWVWTKVANISRHGCFCYIRNPLPVLTKLKMLLKLENVEIAQYAVVRSILPGCGMGLEFTQGACANDNVSLCAAVERLAAIAAKGS
jgi:hypothetical protein